MAVLAGCATNRPIEVQRLDARPGALFSAARIRSYPAWTLRLGLWFAGAPAGLEVRSSMTLYRIGYWTRDPADQPAQATALVGVPAVERVRGVVAYMHGTRTDRRLAPSVPTLEGKLVGATFAGAQYLLVAPDYLGFGTRPGPHPFLHANSTAETVIDALRAAHQLADLLGVAWPEKLFLLGASQGGHAALATHRALEREPVADLVVRATAAAAGPYDLAAISFPVALRGGANSHRVYLGYLVDTYARIYGRSRSSVLRSPYDERVEVLFDGYHDDDAVNAGLPDRPRLMFRDDFLAAYDAGRGSWLRDALAANSVHDWVPRSPLRLYYGTNDQDVPPREAIETARRMSALGAPVEAVCVGALEHEESALSALGPIRTWFDALSR